MIRTRPGLREQLTALDLTDVLNRFASDKKHSSTHFTLILIAPSGEVVLQQIPRSPALDQSIQHAISATIDSVTRSL
jgi:3-dehydroquinate synthase